MLQSKYPVSSSIIGQMRLLVSDSEVGELAILRYCLSLEAAKARSTEQGRRMLGEFEAWMLVDLESQGKWQGASEKTVLAGFQYRSALPLQVCRASRNHRLRRSPITQGAFCHIQGSSAQSTYSS